VTHPDPDRGPWCQVFTGRMFYHRDPRREDIDVRDIARSHALDNRFGGHTRFPVSVAQHAVFVCQVTRALVIERNHLLELDGTAGVYGLLRPERVALAALLHDAAEAYMRDLPRPIKYDLGPEYGAMRHRIQDAIHARFGAHVGGMSQRLIKRADVISLATEARDVMAWPPPAPWDLDEEPLPGFDGAWEEWDWRRAEREFLEHFNGLCRPEDRVTL
jgi:uncharacterized protein